MSSPLCLTSYGLEKRESWNSCLEPGDSCLTLTVARLLSSPVPLISRLYVKKKGGTHLKSVVWNLLLLLGCARKHTICLLKGSNVFSSSSVSFFPCSSSSSFSLMMLLKDFHYILLAYYSNNVNQCIFFPLPKQKQM